MTSKCGRCGQRLRPEQTISVTGVGDRCFVCFNEEIADRMGVAFDKTPLQPIDVADADGVVRHFEIRSMLCATGHEMIAEEVPRLEDGGGYRFAVLGDFEVDALVLFQRLYEKMRREMGKRHVQHTEYGWQLTRQDSLVGRIESDLNADDRQPLLIVDGKALTWDDVGRMLMTYEGFTLRLAVEDSIEVVGGPLLEIVDDDDEA
jgi:hypothetical protein